MSKNKGGRYDNDFNARWEQAISDAREAAKQRAQYEEFARQRAIDEDKKRRGSPLQQLGMMAAATGMNVLANQGFSSLGNSLFGPSTPAPVLGSAPVTSTGIPASGIGGATGGGQGFFSSLFGSSGAPSTAAPIGAETAVPAAPSALGSVGTYALPAAGLYGLYDIWKNKRKGFRGTAQGAAAGAALGSPFGPVGIGVGAALGGAYGTFASKFDKDSWDTERKRLEDLKDQGYAIPQNLFDNSPSKGRSIQELINHDYANDFIGRGKNNEWVNNTFAQSRNEADLRPEDVVGYSAFIKNFGNNYLNAPLEKKLALAKYALENGLINEHQGTIDIEKTNDLEDQAKKILGY